MEQFHFAVLMAIAVGFVSSGLVSNAWNILLDEEPRMPALLEPVIDLRTPFRVLAVLLSAPTTMLLDGFGWTIARPVVGLSLMALSLLWSFFQGVFILNQLFGIG